MRCRILAVVVCGLLVAAASASVARAQEGAAGAPGASLLDEIAGLNRSLDRLVTLLEGVLQNQKVDLLLKRIELRERRIAPMESRLRGLEADLTDGEGETRRLEAMKDREEESLREALRTGVEQDIENLREMIRQIDMGLAHHADRMQDARRRINETENDLASSRREIAILDDMLLELIEEIDR